MQLMTAGAAKRILSSPTSRHLIVVVQYSPLYREVGRIGEANSPGVRLSGRLPILCNSQKYRSRVRKLLLADF